MASRIPPERLQRVEAMLLEGATSRAIERACIDAFGVGRRQVRNYIAKVRKRLAASFAGQDPDVVRARVEAMLLEAYALAKSLGHTGDMERIATRLAELHGAYAKKFEGDVKVSGLADALASVFGDARE